MTLVPKPSRLLFFVALTCLVAVGAARAIAAEETVPLTSDPAADSAQKPSAEVMLEDNQFLPTYSCMPTQACAPRCCLVGPEGLYWFRADYLLWWTQGARVVPLVTQSDPQDGGIIGAPSTEIIAGGRRMNGESRSNFRIRFGWWFDCCRTAGIEFDYFTLGEAGDSFRHGCDGTGNTFIGRPYYDVWPQVMGQNAQAVCDPGRIRGYVDGRIDEYFHSAGVNLRVNLLCNSPGCCEEDGCDEVCGDETCGTGPCRADLYCQGLANSRAMLRKQCYRVDLIAGYRHYKLEDSLRVNESLVTTAPDPLYPAGTTFDLFDSFRSHNDFHGAELGLVTEIYRGRWSLELLAKMAMGNSSQIVHINGQTVTQVPGDVPATNVGGLLALETNIGRYSNNEFVVIPQFGAELGYQVTCNLRAFVGYNFIYWANVARASEQVDYTVNQSYIPPIIDPPEGEARPAFAWQDSDFWAQGINVGAELRY